jgi:hypothetical protein
LKISSCSFKAPFSQGFREGYKTGKGSIMEVVGCDEVSIVSTLVEGYSEREDEAYESGIPNCAAETAAVSVCWWC